MSSERYVVLHISTAAIPHDYDCHNTFIQQFNTQVANMYFFTAK